MKTKTKGQASVEYMLVIGIAFLILIPSFYLFFSNSQRSFDQSTATQVVRIGDEMVSTVTDVYAYGKNSKLTSRFTMPSGVSNVSIVRDASLAPEDQFPGQEIIFTVDILGTPTNFVFFTNYPVSFGPCDRPQSSAGAQNITSGRKVAEFVSCGKNVSIQFS